MVQLKEGHGCALKRPAQTPFSSKDAREGEGIGAAIGLYLPFSKRPLARLLAFAAGSLISAVAISSCGLVPGVVSGSSEAIASPV